MAGPVTHIILALAVLPFMADKDHDAFIAGTSFPDIRYLGVISRQATHKANVTWQEICNEPSSFKAGMLFHAFVDQLREDYLNKSHIYAHIPHSRYASHALKFLEDKLLYDFIHRYHTTWPHVIASFYKCYPEELTFGIKKRYLYLWHALLVFYFRYPRAARFINRALGSAPLLRTSMMHEINVFMSYLEKDHTLHDNIIQFYSTLLSVIEHEAHESICPDNTAAAIF